MTAKERLGSLTAQPVDHVAEEEAEELLEVMDRIDRALAEADPAVRQFADLIRCTSHGYAEGILQLLGMNDEATKPWCRVLVINRCLQQVED